MLALIALDALPASLLAELEGEGRLPRLAEVRRESAFLELTTPGAQFPAGIFPTMWSGVPLKEHGLHYPFMFDATGQRVRHVDWFAYPGTLWDRVSGAGGRVLVVDPYEAPQSTGIVGLFIAGWQFTNRVVLRPSSAPHGARRRWERRFGPAPPGEEVFGETDERSLRHLAAALVAGPPRVADLVIAALPEVRPDVLVAGFPSIHLGGHRLYDPAAVVEGISPRAAAELRRALTEIVVAADVAMGRIIDALPQDTDVVVFSPIGMAADSSRTDVLGNLLSAVLDGTRLRGDRAEGSWGFRAAVPTSLRARVAAALPDRVAIELASRLELRGTDWSRTRAFTVPADVGGMIRFNVRGREREGIVDPDDVAALASEIATGLQAFTFEDGAPAIAGVDVVAEMFGGGQGSHLLPDLVVRWSDRPSRRGEVLHSPRCGSIHRTGVASGRSGNHTDDAWALVRPASGRTTERRRADIVDIAATALARVGLESAGRSLIDSR
jgi:Type I phosphodiesterase / nucleotide pyrophosphatase